MISVEGLSKSFGQVQAVRDLTFSAEPGSVTGFLGPNGAGKTTTLRILLGLVAPTTGRALINGHPYADLPSPTITVGAALEATDFHPGRSARNHLRVSCLSAGLPMDRVDSALDFTGLTADADRRVGGYSLGMRQRLALATAVLGEPKVLILDEPANGLDPGGIHWLRAMLRRLADEGCTVLISSHVLSEVEQTADHVVIIARGRVVTDAPLTDLVAANGELRVRTQQAADLGPALEALGATVRRPDDGLLLVSELAPEEIGRAALQVQAVLSELTQERSALEKIFLDLTMAELSDDATPGGTP